MQTLSLPTIVIISSNQRFGFHLAEKLSGKGADIHVIVNSKEIFENQYQNIKYLCIVHKSITTEEVEELKRTTQAKTVVVRYFFEKETADIKTGFFLNETLAAIKERKVFLTQEKEIIVSKESEVIEAIASTSS
jgi:quinolinate synthase